MQAAELGWRGERNLSSVLCDSEGFPPHPLRPGTRAEFEAEGASVKEQKNSSRSLKCPWVGEGPRWRPLFSSPQGGFATLRSQTTTASSASKSWVWFRHKLNAPASENVPRLNTKLPPPAFYMYLCVKLVFHVKNIIFFSNHIFAKFLLVFTYGARPRTSRPFWRVVSSGQRALVIQQGTQTCLGFRGPLSTWLLQTRSSSGAAAPTSTGPFPWSKPPATSLRVNTIPILFVF